MVPYDFYAATNDGRRISIPLPAELFNQSFPGKPRSRDDLDNHISEVPRLRERRDQYRLYTP
jgi:hypothetical protein